MTGASAAAARPTADWPLVAWLSVAQLVSWGTLYYSFSVLLTPMQAELGWSKAELTGAFSLGLLVAGLCAIPVGAWIDRHGARLLMTGGSLLASALLATWAYTDHLWVFYALWATMGLSLATTLYEPAFAVVAARFGPAYRKGITVMTLLGGLASTAFIPLTQLLVTAFGWRSAVLVLAACNLLVCAVIHAVTLRPRAGDRPHSDAAPRPGAPRHEPFFRSLLASPLLRRALATPVFWGLFACFSCANLMVSGVAAHLVPLLQDRGASIAGAVAMAALFGPSQVLARLGTLGADRWLDSRRLGRGATVLLMLATLALAGAPTWPWLLWVFPVLFGIGNGTMTIVRGTAVPEFLSRSGYATINGALVMPQVLARAGAPLGASLVWGLGGYDAVIGVFLALTLGATVAFWLASRPGGPALER